MVDSLTIDPTVEEFDPPLRRHRDCHGHSKDHYQLADGKDFDLLTHWTAAVVRKDGKWKIAAFHASVEYVRQCRAAIGRFPRGIVDRRNCHGRRESLSVLSGHSVFRKRPRRSGCSEYAQLIGALLLEPDG